MLSRNNVEVLFISDCPHLEAVLDVSEDGCYVVLNDKYQHHNANADLIIEELLARYREQYELAG